MKRIYESLLKPVVDSGQFMLITTVLFIANCLITQFPGKEQTAALGQLLLELYIFAALLMLLPERWRKGARAVGYVVMYVLCIVESFLVMRFNMRIGPSMIMLCMDTTRNESQEFLQLCLKSDEALRVALIYMGILTFHTALNADALKRWIRLPKVVAEVMATIVLLTSCLSIPAWIERQKAILPFLTLSSSRTAERCAEENFYSAPDRMLWSVKFYALIQKEADDMMAHMQNIDIESCDFRCPRIVLIIGESYTKHHSTLYGYPHNTTPWQVSMKESGRLVALEDAVSPWNLTSNVFKDIMSTHSCDEEGNWTDGVLFPAVFRKAGYKVAFLSNQFYANKKQSNCDVSGSFFLNRSDMNALCFNHRSSRHFTTDGIFINRELGGYKHNEHELVIMHLYGQHTTYADRMPKQDSLYVFSAGDYHRPELTFKDRKVMADYDNATHYNDLNIKRIYNQFRDEDAIFVYLSDHGENIFDGGSTRFGRTHDTDVTPLMARYEFEVPMCIFFTDSCKIKHPEVVEAVRNSSRKPFATDDLPHLLMGMAGIHTSYYSAKHDLLSPSYNAHRKRILKGTADYDALIK